MPRDKVAQMIDFIIPTHTKSAHNIPRLVSSLKRLTEQDNIRFNIICDIDDPSFDWLKSLNFASRINARVIATQSYVDERHFLSAISSASQIPEARYKWYWQQFKKLLCFEISDISEKIVLWDSDTFPIGNQVFFNHLTPICQRSYAEYHVPYFFTFANLTGTLILPPFSSITQYSSVSSTELSHIAWLFAYGEVLSDSSRAINFSHDWQKDYFLRIFSKLAFTHGTQSLFADYEYINLHRYLTRKPFLFSKARHFRHGGYLLIPKAIAFFLLNLAGYSNVSYESYHPVDRLKRFLRITSF